MSFILDALKRSERERKETAGDASPTGDERPARGRIWIWIAGAALSLNALGLAAYFMLPSGEQPAAEFSLPPAGSEGGALQAANPSAPAPAGQQPAPAAAAPSVKDPGGPDTETAMVTDEPAQAAPPPKTAAEPPPPQPPPMKMPTPAPAPKAAAETPAPPPPPMKMPTPAPAPKAAAETPAPPPPQPPPMKVPTPAPAPEPAQPAPAVQAGEDPQSEFARTTATAKPRPFAGSEPPGPEAPKGPVTAPDADGDKAQPAGAAPAQPAIAETPALTKAALEDGKREASTYNNRGQAFEREGLYDRAIEEYTRAILIDPTFAEAYLGRGWAHEAKGNHGQAIRNYGEAIGLNASLAEAHYARGWAHEQLGQRDRAIEDYGEAIRIAPDYGDARFSRGILRVYSGQPESAAMDFSAVLEGNGGGLRAYALLWLYLSRSRAGGEPDRELGTHAGRLDLDPVAGHHRQDVHGPGPARPSDRGDPGLRSQETA